MYDFVKRIIDIIISGIALIILSPIFIMAAIAIWLDSPGPIFFSQVRVGRQGKIFKLLKFRSMVPDAETILYTDQNLLKAYKRNSYKIVNDPRVTVIGKFIRRFSIDEFPQFFNVFVGEMSIVGPRAYRDEELKEQQKNYPYTARYVEALLTVKPGITGPWQVSGRSQINFDKRVEMDAYYAQRRSLLYDIMIILKTPWAVIRGRGAV